MSISLVIVIIVAVSAALIYLKGWTMLRDITKAVGAYREGRLDKESSSNLRHYEELLRHHRASGPVTPEVDEATETIRALLAQRRCP